MLFHQVAETSNACLARVGGGGGGGGGASTVRFFWVYAACVSEPPLPHYI